MFVFRNGSNGVRDAILLLGFGILAVLQMLDWHSTFAAIDAGRGEQNRMILSLAQIVGLKTAVSIFKACALGTVFVYARAALKRPYALGVVFMLPLLLFIYLAVVLSNYSH